MFTLVSSSCSSSGVYRGRSDNSIAVINTATVPHKQASYTYTYTIVLRTCVIPHALPVNACYDCVCAHVCVCGANVSRSSYRVFERFV